MLFKSEGMDQWYKTPKYWPFRKPQSNNSPYKEQESSIKLPKTNKKDRKQENGPHKQKNIFFSACRVGWAWGPKKTAIVFKGDGGIFGGAVVYLKAVGVDLGLWGYITRARRISGWWGYI